MPSINTEWSPDGSRLLVQIPPGYLPGGSLDDEDVRAGILVNVLADLLDTEDLLMLLHTRLGVDWRDGRTTAECLRDLLNTEER